MISPGTISMKLTAIHRVCKITTQFSLEDELFVNVIEIVATWQFLKPFIYKTLLQPFCLISLNL